MKLSDLEQLYQDHLAEQETQAKAREAKDQAAKAAIIQTQILPLVIPALATMTGVDADELLAVTSIQADQWTDVLDLDGNAPDYPHLCNFRIVLSVPEHADIVLSPESSAHKSGGAVEIKFNNYRSPWLVRGNSYDSFGDALFMASRIWSEDQERERQRAEEEEKNAALKEDTAVEMRFRRRRRQVLLNQLMMDRVAFRLLQVMVEVAQERDAERQARENAEDDLRSAQRKARA